MKNTGASLVEIMIVILIVSILAAIFGWGTLRSIRSAELREATNQFASDFRRARSQAQRSSVDQVISWGAGTELTFYSVGGKNRTIANNVTMKCLTGCGTGPTANKLTYLAPYGERVDFIGTVFELRSPVASIPPMQVRIVGTTGKVIVGQGT